MRIYIEVKIDSAEHGAQTGRYHQRLVRNSAGRESRPIFISPGSVPANRHFGMISCKRIGAVAGLYCWYDWVARGIKRKEWKNFVRAFYASHESLHENGFIINDDGTAIMRPFALDLECLKDNFLAPDKCFEPIAEAIDAIHSEIKVFDEFAKEANKIARESR